MRIRHAQREARIIESMNGSAAGTLVGTTSPKLVKAPIQIVLA